MKKEKDRFADEKRWAFKKLFPEENACSFFLNLHMEDITLVVHQPNKDWFCYICDRVIEKAYYSLDTSSEWHRPKLCLRCVARIIDFFKMNLQS